MPRTESETAVPTRPGTVYLGKYSFSRETLDQTQDPNQLADFQEPPKTARSLRASLKRAFLKPPIPVPMPEVRPVSVGRHHKFRRWLNCPEKDFTCSLEDTDNGTNEQHSSSCVNCDNNSASDCDESPISIKDELVECGTGTVRIGPHSKDHDHSGDMMFEMFSRMFLDSDSGATLRDDRLPELSVEAIPQLPDGENCESLHNACSRRRKFDLLRRFRSRLHRNRTRNLLTQYTLTEKYMGSDENIQRCLKDMDMMPFDLTAPSTAGGGPPVGLLRYEKS